MIIGCDIGGVIKEMISNNPIPNAIEGIKELETFGHKVIFISKCKDGYREIISKWLKTNNLKNPVYFCQEYSEKNRLCIENNVDIMIDDKLQVFKNIPDSIKKIWFCDDYRKINGALQFQSDEFYRVIVCKNWIEVLRNVYL